MCRGKTMLTRKIGEQGVTLRGGKHKLLCTGNGHLEDEGGRFVALLVPGENVVRVASATRLFAQVAKGECFVVDPARVQSAEKTSEEVFTSLDRPAPMSPEMLRIHQLQRKNEIERERMRAEMEKRINDAIATSRKSRPEAAQSAVGANDVPDPPKSGKGREKPSERRAEDAGLSDEPEPLGGGAAGEPVPKGTD